MSFKNKTVFRRWIISYMIILLVFAAIMSINSAVFQKIITEETYRSNVYLLEQLKENMDNFLYNIERIKTDIISNYRIAGFVSSNSPFDGRKQYYVVEISKDLKRLGMAFNFVDDIYIYSRNYDYILSSRSSNTSREFYNLNYNDTSDEGYRAWIDLLTDDNSVYREVNISGEDGKSIPALMYSQKLPEIVGGKNSATLVIIADKQKFFSGVEESLKENQAGIAVVGKDNDILFKSEFEFPFEEEFPFDLNLENGGHFVEKNYLYSYTSSEVTGWKYIYAVPKSVFFLRARQFKSIQVIFFIIAVIIGFFLSIFFARQNYKPLSRLMKSVSKQIGGAHSLTNEFQYIENVVSEMLDENNKINGIFNRHKSAFKTSFLQNLLNGRKNRDTATKDAAEYFGISFETDCFCLLLIYIDDFEMLFKDEKELDESKQYELASFIICNVIEELMQRENNGYIFEYDNMLAGIFNYNKIPPEDDNSLLIAIINEAGNFVAENFNLHFTAVVSSVVQGYECLPRTYIEISELMEYNLMIGKSEILNAKDIPEKKKIEYYYPIEFEYKLIKCMLDGDAETGKKIIDDIFQTNLPKARYSSRQIKCLIFDIASTVLKVLEQINGEAGTDFVKINAAIDEFTKCDNIQSAHKAINIIIDKICSQTVQDKDNNHGDVEDEIYRFVEVNYGNHALSVPMIAEYCGLTPNYISMLFRKNTGVGLLEYINKVRAEKAAKLLRETDLDIKSIAADVGYSYDGTFARIFKKYYNVTPGIYRKLSREKDI